MAYDEYAQGASPSPYGTSFVSDMGYESGSPIDRATSFEEKPRILLMGLRAYVHCCRRCAGGGDCVSRLLVATACGAPTSVAPCTHARPWLPLPRLCSLIDPGRVRFRRWCFTRCRPTRRSSSSRQQRLPRTVCRKGRGGFPIFFIFFLLLLLLLFPVCRSRSHRRFFLC